MSLLEHSLFLFLFIYVYSACYLKNLSFVQEQDADKAGQEQDPYIIPIRFFIIISISVVNITIIILFHCNFLVFFLLLLKEKKIEFDKS